MRDASSRAVMLAASLLLVANAGYADDQTVLGTKLLVTNPSGLNARRKVVVAAKQRGSSVVLIGDPTAAGTAGGATVVVQVDGDTPSLQTFTLPQGFDAGGRPFWRRTATGFRYKDTRGANGPVKLVKIGVSPKGTATLKAVIQGKLGPVDVVPPNDGIGGCVALHLAADGGGDRYSALFGSDAALKNDGTRLFKASKPRTVGVCPPSTTTTTASSSSTTTATDTTTTMSSTTTTATTTSTTTTTLESTTTTSSTQPTTTTSTTTSTSEPPTTTTTSTSSTTSTTAPTTTTSTTSTTTPPGPFCGNDVREGFEECDGADAVACPGECGAACRCLPPPAHTAAAGDSITQGYNANCTNILCAISGDLPQYSWFNGTSVVSVHVLYQALDPTITAVRESVSGAEMRGGSNSFAAQAARIVAQVPQPDHVEVLLGGNDICNRDCIDPAHCSSPMYTDQQWRDAVRAGLDQLVAGLPLGSTVYLVSVPRVQDLREVGVAKSSSCNTIWSLAGVCRIITDGGTLNGESYATRRAGVSERQQRYNEILREEALAYTANDSGQNPRGIEVVTDYTDETPGTSVGTTPFLTTDINGGDCFHPSVQGQNKLADGIWTLNPDR